MNLNYSNVFYLAALGLMALGAVGCNFKFTSVDGYSFDYSGVTEDKIESGEFNSLAKRVTVENRFGDVMLVATEGTGSWEWSGKVWADGPDDARRLMEQIKVVAEEQGENVMITVVLPEASSQFNGVKSDLRVSIPEGALVTVANAHGNVAATGLRQNVELTSRHGNITATDLMAEVAANNSHGNIKLERVGTADISNAHGNIEVGEVSGGVKISNQHGNVAVQGVTETLIVENRHGQIIAGGVKGDVRVTGAHCSITLSEAQGDVNAETTHASISVSGTPSNMTLKGSHSDLKIEHRSGLFEGLTAETRHGDIHLSVPADTKIQFHVDNQKSFQSEIDSSSDGAKVALKTEHGKIKITKLK